MLGMKSLGIACLLLSGSKLLWSQQVDSHKLAHFDYELVRTHELKPHRRTIPHDGVHEGFNQLHLTLVVSPTGDVIHADASGGKEELALWPELQGEVMQWKYKPFEQANVPVTAEVEEYLELVPPERLPTRKVIPPSIRPTSKIAITLQRTGCFGTCPGYTVTLSTSGEIFEGDGYVVAAGLHRADIDADAVRALAKKFADANFYAMEPMYRAGVTDNPTYTLGIRIDDREAKVVDYVGEWVGMPAIISELEEDVDQLGQTGRWINGDEGLVALLKAEHYNFNTFEAQMMLKEVAIRGKTDTLQELLDAGTSLKPIPAPKPKEAWQAVPFEHVGWLTAAAKNGETLKVLLAAEASKEDSEDKNLALRAAAEAGSLESVRSLIAYGADPNVDLSKLIVTRSGGMNMTSPGYGNILFYAAESGSVDVVREILKYKPKLEQRDRDGKTAIFAAGEYRDSDKDGARVEIVRLLAEAGANVNARDAKGNTPLHETFLTDVEEELLKLGADVNARNDAGETPIFTTYDDDAIPLFIKHGADLSIQNNKGETVIEAAHQKGPQREEALRKAIEESKNSQ